jgi:hypothetical protein
LTLPAKTTPSAAAISSKSVGALPCSCGAPLLRREARRRIGAARSGPPREVAESETGIGARAMSRKGQLGRPPVYSEDVRVRLRQSAIDALDAWIAAQTKPRPSRPEAIRRLLAEALAKHADVKSPTLPQPSSDAFLRALGHR